MIVDEIQKPVAVNTKKKRTIALWIIFSLVFVLLILPFGISVCIYEQNFGVRYAVYQPHSFTLEDFPGLERNACNFESNQGQQLAGWLYRTEGTSPKAVVVVAHGLGVGGHEPYMDCIHFFARNGYLVFAYDVTGNGGSEGDSIRGLSQGVIDLDYAIRHLQTNAQTKELPILLFGHSWGGYSVCNVLNYHPEVKAVVALCGFNRSSDLIRAEGEKIIGPAISLLMPYVSFYEYLKFGDYASSTAMDGFANTDAGIFIVHSQDDSKVPQQYGYDIYFDTYGQDDRFTFVHYTNKGHTYVYASEAFEAYRAAFNDTFSQWTQTLPEDLSQAQFAQQKADYLNEHLDRTVWCDRLDPELFASILTFFDAHLE